MDRLTYYNEEFGTWTYHGPSGDAALRLKSYEDTGLTPEQLDDFARQVSKIRNAAGCKTLEDCYKLAQDERLLVLPCKLGDTLYEIDQPEYGVIVCKVLWINGYIGPMAHVQGNPRVCAVSVSVEVVEGHGKGSSYAFEPWDFGEIVFRTREEAEAALAVKKT